MISTLSVPTSGRSRGRVATAPTAAMFSSVWEATWPRLSPVTTARAPWRAASPSATRSISRRRIDRGREEGDDRAGRPHRQPAGAGDLGRRDVGLVVDDLDPHRHVGMPEVDPLRQPEADGVADGLVDGLAGDGKRRAGPPGP